MCGVCVVSVSMQGYNYPQVVGGRCIPGGGWTDHSRKRSRTRDACPLRAIAICSDISSAPGPSSKSILPRMDVLL